MKRIEHGKPCLEPTHQKWWDKWFGVFADEVLFDEAMRLPFVRSFFSIMKDSNPLHLALHSENATIWQMNAILTDFCSEIYYSCNDQTADAYPSSLRASGN